MSDNNKPEIHNAKIESTRLGIVEDHGFLDAALCVSWDPYEQVFGGWLLQRDPASEQYDINGPAGHFIFRVLQIAGVSSWEELAGRYIRICYDRESGRIIGIGHIVDDDWFYPNKDFKNLK